MRKQAGNGDGYCLRKRMRVKSGEKMRRRRDRDCVYVKPALFPRRNTGGEISVVRLLQGVNTSRGLSLYFSHKDHWGCGIIKTHPHPQLKMTLISNPSLRNSTLITATTVSRPPGVYCQAASGSLRTPRVITWPG